MKLASGLAVAFLLSSLGATQSPPQPATPPSTQPRLRAQGKLLVDPAGQPVTLRGVNLGNWLLIETWMLRLDGMPDQYTIVKILTDRFGKGEANRLLTLYRDHYITARDFDQIQSFGFNLVRLPFAWDLFYDDLDSPPDAPLRPDAFKYLDRALDLAGRRGIYIILDLHGAPGGQSKEHHTYREGQNQFFKDEANLQRAERIWAAIAERYKHHPAIVAYDLLNEPYGDYKEDLRPDLVKLTDRLYKAIRSHDPDTVLLFPGTLQGSIEHYGDPRDKGMKSVGFTEHFYPGLFGSAPRVRSHESLINGKLKARRAYLDKLQAPYLVGEFNVVLDKAGGDPMMRRYYDLYAANGWLATAWSYKLLKPEPGAAGDNWYFVTNADPLPKLDLRTATKPEIEAWFRNLGTMKLAADESLRAALSSPQPPPIPEDPAPALPKAVPTDPLPAGWSLTTIGAAPISAGYRAGSKPALIAAGTDVWGQADAFAFLHHSLASDGELTVTITTLAESHEYAKAGLMLRAGTAPDAAVVFLNAFPDGTVAFAHRSAPGETLIEKKFAATPFPVRLRLVRKGDQITAYRARPGRDWTALGTYSLPEGALQAGLAVCSHDETLLTEAGYEGLQVRVAK